MGTVVSGPVKCLVKYIRFVNILICVISLHVLPLTAGPIAVRYMEGVGHGFIILKNLNGETLAYGDLTQIVRADRVTSRMLFHFKDGSIHDETTVFSQLGTFHLLSEHLIQKGPSFSKPIEMTIDTSTGRFTAHYTDKGKDKFLMEHVDLPPDVANGLVFILLKNIDPNAPRTSVSFLGGGPKARVVKLLITPQGEEPFSIAGSNRKATHYVIKVQIGGVAGFVAPIIGKQPADTHVWMLAGAHLP
jgi:hypothetical protein